MTYDDWKTSTPDCDEEPCWRCKSAQKDVGNYCGDCAKGEAMAELDLDKLGREYEADPEGYRMQAHQALALIAAARELAELKGAMAHCYASGHCGASIMEPERILDWARELGWTGKAE